MSNSVLKTEVVIPRLPRLNGAQVDIRYLDQLVRALENAIDILNSTRQRNVTAINLTNTQEHGAGLRTGDIFSDDGILKIVRAGEAYADTFVATTALGSVTVSTP
jgi:hypothetical protein